MKTQTLILIFTVIFFITVNVIVAQTTVTSTTGGTTNKVSKFDGTYSITNSIIYDDGTNIGIGTTSPTNILSLDGNSARTIWMERHTTANTAGNSFTLQSGGATSGATDKNGGDLNLKTGTATGTGSSNLLFFTSTAGTTGTTDRSPTEKMRITGSGNVGIGITNPSSLLDVKLPASVPYYSTAASFRADNNANVFIVPRLCGWGYSHMSAEGDQGIFWTDGAGGSGNNSNAGFVIAPQGTALLGMRISKDGYVGINTASPGTELDVKGTLRLSGSTSGYVGFAPAAAAGSTTYTLPSADGSSGQVLQTNGSGTLSWLTPSAGTVTGSGTATRLAFWSGSSALSSNANLFWDNTNNRLGIGTSSPTAILNVVGTSTDGTPNNDGTQISNGAVELARSTFPYLDFNGWTLGQDYDSRIILYAENILSFLGAPVGINYTTYNANYRLSVGGNSYFNGYVNFTGALYANGNSGTSGQLLISQGTSTPIWQNGSTALNGTSWLLTGNSGTSPGTNFIGTTDAQKLMFKVNNVQAGLMDYDVSIANTYFGYQSGLSNTSGYYNTGIGYQTLYSSTTGRFNTAIGINALMYTTTGNYNTALGYALFNNTTGSDNTAIGENALLGNTTGNENTALGSGADVSSGSLSNSTAIGANAVANASNQVRLGDQNITTLYCMGAYAGTVGVTNRDLYVDNTGKIGYLSSSKRYKNNIKDMEDISWLYQLRPVNYIYKNDSTNSKQYGLIAEEVEKLNPLFVSYNPDGTIETVNYSRFISPLVKAVQEQKKMIDNLTQQQKTKDSIQTATINSLLVHQKTTDSLLIALQNCCSLGSTNEYIQNNNNEQGNLSNHNIELSSNAVLYQNSPNPFSDGTIIKYFVPGNSDAQIVFYDEYGKQLKLFKIAEKGMGQLNISVSNLAAGMYSYSLIVNEKVIDTKKMIKQ